MSIGETVLKVTFRAPFPTGKTDREELGCSIPLRDRGLQGDKTAEEEVRVPTVSTVTRRHMPQGRVRDCVSDTQNAWCPGGARQLQPSSVPSLPEVATWRGGITRSLGWGVPESPHQSPLDRTQSVASQCHWAKPTKAAWREPNSSPELGPPALEAVPSCHLFP